jgi:hypothetical protein
MQKNHLLGKLRIYMNIRLASFESGSSPNRPVGTEAIVAFGSEKFNPKI